MAFAANVLDQLTVDGELTTKLEDGSVRCFACGHRCLVRPGRRGICQVRFNENGNLRIPWGYVAALNADPIEKKPFFHILPGSIALTFGMLGCDFHCGYCQNWFTSQAMRDPDSEDAREKRTFALLEELGLRARGIVLLGAGEPIVLCAVDWIGIANEGHDLFREKLAIAAGTTPHICGELFKQLAKINLLHVPYKGSAPAQQDLLAFSYYAVGAVKTWSAPGNADAAYQRNAAPISGPL